jgi:ATP/maltotriose-dependent transcriptional regulator MalT
MQHGRIDEALAWLEPAWEIAEDAGPRAAIGGLLSIVYASAGRADQACAIADSTEKVEGGTYSDRLWRRWGEGFARLQLGDVERGLAAIDDADAIAAETDSLVDQAIASLARAVALSTVGHGHAPAADADARERLRALGVTGYGWERVFAIAARPVSAPSTQ